MQNNPIFDISGSQSIDTPLQHILLPNGELICGYQRATESVLFEEKNQDAYRVLSDKVKGVVVLADGVGQSFRGDIASSYLVDLLARLLWKYSFVDTERLESLLSQELSELSPLVTKIIEGIELEQYPRLFREALLQKRGLGSESVFCATVYDFESDCIALCWLGDIRVHIYDTNDQRMILPQERFQSMERWSSVRKLVGTINCTTLRLSQVKAVCLYSDGLSALDTQNLIHPFAFDQIKEAFDWNASSPISDDATYVQILFRNV